MKSNSAPSGGQRPEVFTKTITKTVSCKYLLFLPEGYDTSEQRWPMILFLHGSGERGDNLEKVKVHGLPRILEKKRDLPFIVVSPQCPGGQWWSNEVLIELLNYIVSRYAVDTERIYLTGLSMGGCGTWNLACTYPERFAAIAPICGRGEPFLADKLLNVAVWAFHGARDKSIPLERSQEMVKAVRACGGDAKLTVYPQAGHDSWTVTYDNPQLYNWFLRHRRREKPK